MAIAPNPWDFHTQTLTAGPVSLSTIRDVDDKLYVAASLGWSALPLGYSEVTHRISGPPLDPVGREAFISQATATASLAFGLAMEMTVSPTTPGHHAYGEGFGTPNAAIDGAWTWRISPWPNDLPWFTPGQ
jgi:hypothetical protein